MNIWSFPTLLSFRSNEFDECFFGKLIAGIDYLEFRPSEIAAAVAVSVLKELQAIEIDKAIIDLLVVEKVRLLFPHRAYCPC